MLIGEMCDDCCIGRVRLRLSDEIHLHTTHSLTAACADLSLAASVFEVHAILTQATWMILKACGCTNLKL